MSAEDEQKITFLHPASDTHFLTHTLIRENPAHTLVRELSNINFVQRTQSSTVPEYYDRIIEDLAMIRINDPSIQEQLNALMNVLRKLTPKPTEERLQKCVLPFAKDFEGLDCDSGEDRDITLEASLKELRTLLTVIQRQLFIRDQLRIVDTLATDDLCAFMAEYWGPTNCEACTGAIAIPRSLYFLQTLYSAVTQPTNDAHASTFEHYDFQSLQEKIQEIFADIRTLVLSICEKIPQPSLETIERWHQEASNVFKGDSYGEYADLIRRIQSSTPSTATSTGNALDGCQHASPSTNE